MKLNIFIFCYFNHENFINPLGNYHFQKDKNYKYSVFIMNSDQVYCYTLYLRINKLSDNVYDNR